MSVVRRRRRKPESYSTAQLAAMAECSVSTVIRWLRAAGLEPPGRGRIDRDTIMATSLGRIFRGPPKTVTEVAKVRGVARSTAARELADAPRVGSRVVLPRDVEMANAYQCGPLKIPKSAFTLRELAEVSGMHRTTMARWLKAHGIERDGRKKILLSRLEQAIGIELAIKLFAAQDKVAE